MRPMVKLSMLMSPSIDLIFAQMNLSKWIGKKKHSLLQA